MLQLFKEVLTLVGETVVVGLKVVVVGSTTVQVVASVVKTQLLVPLCLYTLPSSAQKSGVELSANTTTSVTGFPSQSVYPNVRF